MIIHYFIKKTLISWCLINVIIKNIMCVYIYIYIASETWNPPSRDSHGDWFYRLTGHINRSKSPSLCTVDPIHYSISPSTQHAFESKRRRSLFEHPLYMHTFLYGGIYIYIYIHEFPSASVSQNKCISPLDPQFVPNKL